MWVFNKKIESSWPNTSKLASQLSNFQMHLTNKFNSVEFSFAWIASNVSQVAQALGKLLWKQWNYAGN